MCAFSAALLECIIFACVDFILGMSVKYLLKITQKSHPDCTHWYTLYSVRILSLPLTGC